MKFFLFSLFNKFNFLFEIRRNWTGGWLHVFFITIIHLKNDLKENNFSENSTGKGSVCRGSNAH